MSGGMFGDIYRIDLHRLPGGGVTVPGSTTQIIINVAGALGADEDFTFDPATDTFSVGAVNGAVIQFYGDVQLPADDTSLIFTDSTNTGSLRVTTATLTNNRTWQLPDFSGTLIASNATWPAVTLPGDLTLDNGTLYLGTAGNGIAIAEGSDATLGTATLSGGTVTVSTAAVTANSRIFVFVQTPGGTQGHLSIGTVTAGTSFVINSTSGSETSTVAWIIFEPA